MKDEAGPIKLEYARDPKESGGLPPWAKACVAITAVCVGSILAFGGIVLLWAVLKWVVA